MAGFYFHRTPFWTKLLYPKAILKVKRTKPAVYLTFDDGPHSEITPWVLNELDKYSAKATFFCLGKNALSFPSIVKDIRAQGHFLGNHGFHHLNGWKTETDVYIGDINAAAAHLGTPLFRPPYGKLTRKQYNLISQQYRIALWSLMPGDFDSRRSTEKCIEQCLRAIKPGDIVVLHDSEKAWPKLQALLPALLEEVSERGWKMESLKFLAS